MCCELPLTCPILWPYFGTSFWSCNYSWRTLIKIGHRVLSSGQWCTQITRVWSPVTAKCIFQTKVFQNSNRSKLGKEEQTKKVNFELSFQFPIFLTRCPRSTSSTPTISSPSLKTSAGRTRSWGTRGEFWTLKYHCDQEPKIAQSGHTRWQIFFQS